MIDLIRKDIVLQSINNSTSSQYYPTTFRNVKGGNLTWVKLTLCINNPILAKLSFG